ncbi:hypothetical protein BV25DRAFT_1870174 [Artomyces pyxidatus]|uniref:Uncharacterized protein n=1 Tax=Artomyces pyxidatus TaxID=48021 RepID=A0ACB8T1P3_9AGAM|nr:hypothetical protein BV25DRAFT_1870174 [Artomyces pyxidatus]
MWDAYIVIAPPLISDYEKVHYWNGMSSDPPELLYHPDLDSNAFPVPVPGERWSELLVKTAKGVFGTPLNVVWDIVASMIYSAINTACFSTHDEEGKKTLGPIVIWIASHPNTTSTENAHDTLPNILKILEDHNVHGAVVEWYEGSMEKLSGPVLQVLRIADETKSTHYIRRAFTATLGVLITKKEREGVDVQGTVLFFNFHEGRDKNGDPSVRVFAVSNKHVLCGNGAPRQLVRVCGFRRTQHCLSEIRALVATNAKPNSEDPEQAKEDEDALETKTGQLEKISTENDHHYTQDIGTIELDACKFKDHFMGNVVHLGNKFTSHLPYNQLLEIHGVVPRELLATPNYFDKIRDPFYVVGKDGNTTGFIVGHYSRLEAYLCNKFGQESIKLPVYNYNKMSSNFSTKGNSGSLIFTGDGCMVAILHSGMRKGFSSHQLKDRYPHANFKRETFFPV